MSQWLDTVLTAVGSSIITCIVMEAYFQRAVRQPRNMGDYDEGME